MLLKLIGMLLMNVGMTDEGKYIPYYSRLVWADSIPYGTAGNDHSSY